MERYGSTQKVQVLYCCLWKVAFLISGTFRKLHSHPASGKLAPWHPEQEHTWALVLVGCRMLMHRAFMPDL